MKIITPYCEVLTKEIYDRDYTAYMLGQIERIARTCYKSDDRITDESAPGFVRALIARGHEAMLEHLSLSVRFVCDRGVSHELVRHRLASFAQESTRYCNYSGDSFGNEITVIKPIMFAEGTEIYNSWRLGMEVAEETYMRLLQLGAKPQEARSVLPNSVKTEVVMTANLREWRHFFKLRALRETGPAHPQMEELTQPLLCELYGHIPVIFDDLYATLQDLVETGKVKGDFETWPTYIRV